jgi:hypothetical protein
MIEKVDMLIGLEQTRGRRNIITDDVAWTRYFDSWTIFVSMEWLPSKQLEINWNRICMW